jgi:hypothetical protein
MENSVISRIFINLKPFQQLWRTPYFQILIIKLTQITDNQLMKKMDFDIIYDCSIFNKY